MERLVTLIRKVPFGVWLFLIATGLLNIFAEYGRLKDGQDLLATYVEMPELPPDFVDHAESFVFRAQRGLFAAVVGLIGLSVCAVVRYRLGPIASEKVRIKVGEAEKQRDGMSKWRREDRAI